MVDVQYVSSIFPKTIWQWQFGCSEECTSESVIKSVCNVNIRSIQEDIVFDMCVGSLIICCKANCTVRFSIEFSSWLDLAWQYQFFDLAFKSPINTITNGLFWHKLPKFNSRLSMNFSNLSWIWLWDLYKETKLQILPPKFNAKLIHSCRYWILRTRKGSKFFTFLLKIYLQKNDLTYMFTTTSV